MEKVMKFEKGKIYRAFSNQPGLHKLTMASAEFSKVARKAKAPVVIVQHLPDFQALNSRLKKTRRKIKSTRRFWRLKRKQSYT